ncbi:MAG: CARDB domain-containing protein [Planctomycetota bacterium]
MSSRFRVEALEPRVLLSAQGLDGQELSGSLSFGERDSYVFELTKPTTLYLDELSRTSQIHVTLEGPDGVVLDEVDLDDAQDDLPSVPLPAGTYRLTLDGTQIETVEYALRLIELGEATPVVRGVPVDGVLSTSKDTAAFRFDAVAGERLFLDLIDRSGSDRSRIRVIGPDGSEVLDRGDDTDRDSDAFITPRSGTYYLLYEGDDSATTADRETTFTFVLTTVEPIEGSLTIGTPIEESVAAPGELRRYSFALLERKTLLMVPREVGDAEAFRFQAVLRDESGDDFVRQTASDTADRLVELLPGAYTLEIEAVDTDQTGAFFVALLDMQDAIGTQEVQPDAPFQLDLTDGLPTPVRLSASAGERFVLGPPDADTPVAVAIVFEDGSVLNSGVFLSNLNASSPLRFTAPTDGDLFFFFRGRDLDAPTDLTIERAPITTESLTLGTPITGSFPSPSSIVRYRFTLAETTVVATRLLAGTPDGATSILSNLNGDDGPGIRADGSIRTFVLEAGEHELSLESAGAFSGSFTLELLDAGTLISEATGTSVNTPFDIALAGRDDRAVVALGYAPGDAAGLTVDAISTGRSLNYAIVNRSGEMLRAGSITGAGSLINVSSSFSRLEAREAGQFFAVFTAGEEFVGGDTARLRALASPGVIDTGTETPIVLGETVSGELTETVTTLEYTLTLDQPKLVLLDSLATTSAETRPRLFIPSAANAEFAGQGQSLGGADERFVFLPAGTHRIIVTDDGSSFSRGPFSFTVVDVSNPEVLQPGTPTGEIVVGPENRVFAIDAETGGTLAFEAFVSSGRASDVRVAVFTESGEFLRSSSLDFTTGQRFFEETVRGGRLYVMLSLSGPTRAPVTMTFEGAATALREQGPVELGQTISGVLSDRRDVVSYDFTLERETTLLINTLGYEGDVRYRVVRPDGSDFSGRFSLRDGIPIFDSGSYTLEVFLDRFDPTTDAAYALRLVDMGAPATAASTDEIISGSISRDEPALRRRYQLSAGEQFSFEWSATGGTGDVAYIELRRPGGNTVFNTSFRYGDDVGQLYTALYSGAYDLTIYAHEDVDADEIGSFEFALLGVATTTEPLVFGERNTGSIAAPYSTAAFAFELDTPRLVALAGLDSASRYTLVNVATETAVFTNQSASILGDAFTLDAGSYRLEVRASGDNPLEFDFRAIDLTASQILGEGAPLNADLSIRNDLVAYAIDLVAGARYALLSDLPSSIGFELVDSQGNATSLPRTTGGNTSFDSPGSGRYYLLIGDSFSTGTGSLTLADVSRTPRSLTIGALITDVIDTPGEQVRFEFSAAPGTLLYLEDRGSNESGRPSIRYTLLDDQGTIAARTTGVGFSSSDAFFPVLAGGDYTLVVEASIADQTAPFGFRVRDLSTVIETTPGTTVAGTIAAGPAIPDDPAADGDVFYRIGLVRGQKIALSAIALPGGASVRLLDLNGTSLVEQFGVGTSSEIVIENAGTYLLRVLRGTESGQFQIGLQGNGLVDPVDVSGLETFVPGQEYSGTTSRTDPTSFSFSPTESVTLYLDSLTGGSSVDFTVLDLFGEVASVSASGRFVTLDPGSYRIQLETFSTTRSFRFRAIDVSGATPISEGSVVVGTTEQSDAAVYAIDGVAGQQVYFDANAMPFVSSSQRPQLRLFDLSGTERLLFSLTRSASGLYELPETGRYLVVVEGRTSTPLDFTFITRQITPAPEIPLNLAQADLLVEDLSVDDSTPTAGSQLRVSWMTRNAGAETLDTTFVEQIELLDVDVVVAQINLTYDPAIDGPIAPGQSVMRSVLVDLPLSLSGEVTVRVVTDAGNAVPEGAGEANNTSEITIDVTAAPAPDLEVIAATLDDLALQAGQSFTLRYTVRNSGTAAATGSWTDRILVFNDRLGTQVAEFVVTNGPIGIGATAERVLTATVPEADSGFGPLRFVVVTDADNAIAERNGDGTGESNNTAEVGADSGPGFYPDLIVPSLTVEREDGSMDPVLTGDRLIARFTIENRGNAPAPGGTRFQLIVRNVTTGGQIRTFFLTLPGAGIAAGESFSGEETVILPETETAVGDLEFRIVADSDNSLLEFDPSLDAEGNNERSLVVPVTLRPNPDLTVTSASLDVQQLPVPFVLARWTVENQGTGDTREPWADRIVISRDPGGNDIVFSESVAFNGRLNPGESVDRVFALPLPDELPLDEDLYVRVIVDATLRLDESNELNNTLAFDRLLNDVVPQTPDLVVSAISLPSEATFGQQIELSFDVTNQGDAATRFQWRDRVWISRNPVFNQDEATLLSQVVNTSSLQSGESYRTTISANLSTDLDPAEYFVFVMADGLSIPAASWFDAINSGRTDPGVYELNGEDNNMLRAGALEIVAPPTPDLRVVQVETAIDGNAPRAGEFLRVRYQVANLGFDPTPSSISGWSDEVSFVSGTNVDARASASIRVSYIGVPLEPFDGSNSAESSYTFEALIRIPVDADGLGYIIVDTDSLFQVEEFDFELNNSFAAVIDVIPLDPPDLVPEAVAIPGEAVAGQPFQVVYRVRNEGQPTINNTTWLDRIVLYESDAPGAEPIATLATERRVGFLETREFYEVVEIVEIPVELAAGTYFIGLQTDYNTEVFEGPEDTDGETNNLLLVPIEVREARPDLEIEVVDVPEKVVAGEEFTVRARVTNTGVLRTDEIWTDAAQVFLGGTWRSIGVAERRRELAPGESYVTTIVAVVPFQVQGTLQFRLIADDPSNGGADGGGRLWEGGGEAELNVTDPQLLVVNRLEPDLQIRNLAAPMAAVSGALARVEWTTVNLGENIVRPNTWGERVYISSRNDGTELLLLRTYADRYIPTPSPIGRNASLGIGGSLEGGNDFIIPAGLSAGTYYIYVQTDVRDEVIEEAGEGNNLSAPIALQITESAAPVLRVTAASIPPEAIEGDSFEVEYTITNEGGPLLQGWAQRAATELGFYLSVDDRFDGPSDIQRDRTFLITDDLVGLPNGGQISGSLNGSSVPGLLGSLFGFVDVNVNNAILREGSERPPAAGPLPILVTEAPLTDLASAEVQLPAAGASGQIIEVTYRVQNTSGAPLAARWFDTLYLSADDAWDIDDPLVATIRKDTVSDPVPAGGFYEETVEIVLPGVLPGPYRLILRSDIRDQLPETDEGNNLLASITTVNVDAEPLQLGVPSMGLANPGALRYFRVDVPADTTLVIDVESGDQTGAVELFASFGTVPSRSQFELRSESAFEPDSSIRIETTEAGTYYVLAYWARSGDDVPFTIQANTLDFGITDEGYGLAGNAGQRTIIINGAKFGRETVARLIAPGGETIEAQRYYYVSEGRFYATFDLRDVDPAMMALEIESSRGEVDRLDDALEVVAGGGADLRAQISAAEFYRIASDAEFFIEWSNEGLNDAFAPLVQVRSPFRMAIGDGPLDDTEVRFYGGGLSVGGPDGLLLPNERRTQVLEAFIPGDASLIGPAEITTTLGTTNDPQPFDMRELATRVRIPNLDTARFEAAIAWLEAEYGADTAGYVRLLSDSATQMSELFGDVRSLEDLERLALRRAVAATGPSVSGDVIADSFRVTIEAREVVLTEVTTGLQYQTFTLGDGSFIFEQVLPGEYRVETDAGVLESVVVPGGGDGTAIVGDSAVTDAVIRTSAGASVTGLVLDTTTGLAVPGARVEIIGQTDGTGFDSDIADNSGRFTVDALPAGTYTLRIVPGSGFAPGAISITLGEDEAAEASLSVVPESRIRGVLELSDLLLDPAVLSSLSFVARRTDGPGVALGEVQASMGLAITGQSVSDALFMRPATPADLRLGGPTVEFGFGGLDAGSYDISITLGGSEIASIDNVSLAPEEVKDLGTRVSTEGVGIVGGLVESLVPGQGVAGLFIELVDPTGEIIAVTRTTEAGNFAIFTGATGELTLRARSLASGVVTPISLTLGESGTEGRVLRITQGASLSGSVRFADGTAASRMAVELIGPDGVPRYAVTNDAGAYTFDTLPDGDYTVTLLSSATQAQATVADGLSASADLTLTTPLATLSGRVLVTAGDEPGATFVTLYREGREVAQSAVEPDGSYGFSLFGDGGYTAVVNSVSGRFAPAAHAFTVSAASGALTHDFAAGSATATVTIDGAGAGVTISLLREDAPDLPIAGIAQTNGQGEAVFEGLAPGIYRFRGVGSNATAIGTFEVFAGNDSYAETGSFAPTRDLVVTTTTPAGVVVEGVLAQVQVYEAGTSRLITAASTQFGSPFTFTGVEGELFDFVVSANGFAPQVVTGVANELSIELSLAPETLTGVVRNSDGIAIRNAGVMLRDAAGRALGFTTADSEGRYTFSTGDDLTGLTIEADQTSYALVGAPAANGLSITTQLIALGRVPAGFADVANAQANASGTEDGRPRDSLPGSLTGGSGGSGERAGEGATQTPDGHATRGLGSFFEFFAEEAVEWSNAALPVTLVDNFFDDFDDAPQPRVERSVIEDIIGALRLNEGDPCFDRCIRIAESMLRFYDQADRQYASVLRQIEDMQNESKAALGLNVLELTKLGTSSALLAYAGAGAYAGATGTHLATSIGAPTLFTSTAAADLAGGWAIANTSAAVAGVVADFGMTFYSYWKAAPGQKKAGDVLSDTTVLFSKTTDALLGVFGGSGTPKLNGGASLFLQGLSIAAAPLNFIDGTFALRETRNQIKTVESLESLIEQSKRNYRATIENLNYFFDRLLLCIEECANQDGDDDRFPGDSPPNDTKTPQIINSQDPNDIIGPAGAGPERWTAGDQTLRYRVRFENDPVFATAAARLVTIDLPLDEDFDIRTLRFTRFGFGDFSFNIPEGRSFYQERVDLSEEQGFFVDFTASIDLESRTVSWSLRTVDPVTGGEPTDALAGFLPVNDDNGAGEGFVDFTVLSSLDAETGTRIEAQASIVFDDNEAIATPEVFNTLDFEAPSATVTSAERLTGPDDGPGDILVRWEGTDSDPGSGLASVTVYVSQDGGPFIEWLTSEAVSSGVFTGTPGSTYAFAAVASDLAGNRERFPLLAETTVFLDPGPPATVADAYDATEDTPLVVGVGDGVLANDDEGVNSELEAELVSGPAVGTLSLAADGSFTYSPPADFSGEVSFAYVARNRVNGEASSETLVTIAVAPVNDPATIALPDGPMVPEGSTAFFDAGGVGEVLLDDVESASTGLVFELELEALGGVVIVGAGSGATISGNSSEIVSLVGTLTELNSALAGLSVARADGQAGTLELRLTLTDPGEPGQQSATTTASTTITYVELAPLSVTAAAIEDGSVQRSVIRTITLELSGVAGSVDDSMLTLTSDRGGTVTVEASLAPDRRSVELSWGGVSLADGNWTLQVGAMAILRTDGDPLASPFSLDFHRLFGDTDGDRDVDIADMRDLSAAFGASVGQPNYDFRFDGDADGDVDADDVSALTAQLGKALPAPSMDPDIPQPTFRPLVPNRDRVQVAERPGEAGPTILPPMERPGSRAEDAANGSAERIAQLRRPAVEPGASTPVGPQTGSADNSATTPSLGVLEGLRRLFRL